ncbi:DUF4291 domain-containing protein [Chitinophagaceae bacterium MMS25-I14]
MTIDTENYLAAKERLPQEGRHILAHQPGDSIILYQAYNERIAAFAAAHQYLGGPDFSYSRMSWVKPNFLWMMYRCGWATKPDQERVLAIRIAQSDFDSILQQAVFSTYRHWRHSSEKEWTLALKHSDVRLQWDPDHSPSGNKLTRKAIQLGLRGKVLETFGKKYIQSIEDITDFVAEQRSNAGSQKLHQLLVPVENIYRPANIDICRNVELNEDE